MNEQMLFRLAMVLQNQAPSTLNKSLCKLAETLLCDHVGGLSLAQLQGEINQQFNLDFSVEEIRNAIERRAQKEIYYQDGKYHIREYIKQKILSETPFSDCLNRAVKEYIIYSQCTMDSEEISSLLIRYLYYCFNSNVDNLLSLCEGKVSEAAFSSFDATNEQITIINGFVTWEDPEKNALIYSIVSTCYDYCMLTIKKNTAVSRELFKGKRFYFDANLIFRMAGINNTERQIVTQRFVKHCKDAGIALYCTTATMDEVYRVLSAQIDYIKSLAGEGMPVSCDTLRQLSPDIDVNDFYRLYYEWCLQPQNTPGDFLAFSEYLRGLINKVFRQLEVRESGAYKIGKTGKEFDEKVQSLFEYKNKKRKRRKISHSSAETDVTNISDTLKLRNGAGNTIWQTNDFIVSADQLLIGWANETYTGIPLVVLPSVWLSVILRFNGRTDDDYKSFCLFLTQRYHIDSTSFVDPALLLENINVKTTKTEIKEQIILEIAQNKSTYSFDSIDDYADSVDHAFDVILNQLSEKTSVAIDELKQKMQDEVDAAKVSAKEEYSKKAALEAESERDKTIVILAKRKASQKTGIFRKLYNNLWILKMIAILVICFTCAIWLWNIEPYYNQLLKMLPEKVRVYPEFVWGIFSCIIALLFSAIKNILSSLGSPEREKAIFEIEYKKLSSVVGQYKDAS